jgi:hypothetical protein
MSFDGATWVDHTNRPFYFKLSSASIVPFPAAAWLFGSGLIGLIGVARRKVRG